MKGLRGNVRNREVSDLQRCPLVQVLLYIILYIMYYFIYNILLNTLASQTDAPPPKTKFGDKVPEVSRADLPLNAV